MLINYEFISLWVAIASLLVSIAATWIAKSSLSQAKQVADRDRSEWIQRKWFDLYLKANQAYDSLDYFRALQDSEPPLVGTTEWLAKRGECWNEAMFLLREAHAMAAVFPKNPVIDELFAWTMGLSNPEEAVSKERMEKLFDAVSNLRQKALVDSSILP